MLVKVASVFNCNADQLLNEMKKSKSLIYIGKPLVHFVEIQDHLLPVVWEEGEYPIKLYIFGFIPFGTQWIVISIDEVHKRIRDNGYSKFIKRWDHNISLVDQGNNKTLYTDTIEINAGILTWFIVLFANVFFRLRHFRWKKLVDNNFQYID